VATPPPSVTPWLAAMQAQFPGMDSWPHAELVVVSFDWSTAAEAYAAAFEFAGVHGVGFYDPQEDALWIPRGADGLDLVAEDRAQPRPDPAPVALDFLQRLSSSGAIERDSNGQWDDLVRRITLVLDAARNRSPISELNDVLMDHDAVVEVYASKAELRAQLVDAVVTVLGRPPSSTTGWV